MKKVTLGKQASIFHDPSVGLTITTGEVVTLTSRQSSSPRVMKAIRAGYLVDASSITPKEVKHKETPAEAPKEEVQLNPSELVEQFNSIVEKGKSPKDIANSFNKDELTAIANEFDIEVEESDTKVSIVEAILADGEEGEETQE